MTLVEKMTLAIIEADIEWAIAKFPEIAPGEIRRATAEDLGHGHYIPMAIAALEAMREPTSRMCDAGEGHNLRCGCPDCDHEAWEKVAAGYTAMIDAALKEHEDASK